MNLHEYQSKELLRSYGLPIADFRISTKALGIGKFAYELAPGPFVCKCQVHAGARGKAGGVAVVNTPAEAEAFAAKWLGARLVTSQTGPEGKLVSRILIERATESVRELYVGATIDRTSSNLTIMAAEGGVSIEEMAAKDATHIHRVNIDLLMGPQPYQGRALAYKLGLKGKQVNEFAKIFMGIARAFLDKDLSLVEINPLAVTTDGSLLCLDAKINIDSYSLYRHPEFLDLDDPSQEDPRIARAVASNFSYVPLNGSIGCLVNGAGLAMGTMDIIKACGGEPANFLDVGGTATKERVMEAFKIILEDKNVKCILVNIFGGIVRCDLIAEGILGAVHEVGTDVPVVVRLEGNHAEDGATILQGSGLNITSVHGLREAALAAVQKAAC
ncbi:MULTISPECIES: ADP-forming succinate--CoA ligase subunit beta [unclassified Anaerobiospirillum]|uniref:ADP-forming succinate--CoA ligase subunit beta n=1 Tax=unclassified Anaerobiospirillum TaxID=2647410 RepID=UPI001FF1F1DB|nr:MULTISPECIES: ADP-forming succinate--CoA ligase subunit beta [unclassified Anaerobiospirillum]MCK0526112.1 ADP-forming succinate--CoA ligase subunit beta [Anaerobiospirillum sp. NML120449]MCK0534895.1 ADP-forming succinate--CoA ligase subunit beta [Anaerobiospirillum sp. NML120511]MCK0540077.1 ADP-forming succinate--CoA ligase subunit beta [Anaerobiospirillum sp. NML02-A-032]